MEKKEWTGLFLACASALVGAALLLCPFGSAEMDALIAEKEGWALVRGAEMEKGQTVTVARQQYLQGALMLVSPRHPLPEDYPAPDVRTVHAVAGNFVPAARETALRAEVIYALCRMQLDRSMIGQAAVGRGAVSYAQQEAQRKEAFARYAQVYPLQEAVNKAAAAVPGGMESEHRTGYALDMELQGALALKEENPLYRNEAGAWIGENMWRYGLIQRYAPGAWEEGSCEGVHLRYVGLAHAAAMRTLGVGLEDYLLLLHREGECTLLRDGKPYAYLLCVPEAAFVTFQAPQGAAIEVSGDNAGYVVAAVAAQRRF